MTKPHLAAPLQLIGPTHKLSWLGKRRVTSPRAFVSTTAWRNSTVNLFADLVI